MSKNQKVLIWIGVILAAFLLFGNRLKMMFGNKTSTAGTRPIKTPLSSQTPDLQTLALKASDLGLKYLMQQQPAYVEDTAPTSTTTPEIQLGDFGGALHMDLNKTDNPVIFDNTPDYSTTLV